MCVECMILEARGRCRRAGWDESLGEAPLSASLVLSHDRVPLASHCSGVEVIVPLQRCSPLHACLLPPLFPCRVVRVLGRVPPCAVLCALTALMAVLVTEGNRSEWERREEIEQKCAPLFPRCRQPPEAVVL